MSNCQASDWNRWDVHLHAPGTALSDNFADDWDGYLKSIENASPRVVALGITDYCSLDCYVEFLAQQAEGRARSVGLVFPNIEFRLMPFTTGGRPLNVHLLVSPEETDHVERCRKALSRLGAVFGDDRVTCDRESLAAFGREHARRMGIEKHDDGTSYKLGVEQFKIDTSAFLEWYSGEPWLEQNSLLAVAGGKDGLAGIRRDSGFKQFHDQLVRRCDIVFSSQKTDREYFLGLGADSAEAITDAYGALKPCLHGSDAHSVAETLRPTGNRYCWIKACPTFDGLRQVLYEPDERVHIGEEPPTALDPDRVIAEISIRNHNGWFSRDRLPLSSNLTAIVGEKGSGKTALADLIAFGSGSWTDYEGSFLHKAGKHLHGAEVTLRWASGRTSRAVFGSASSEREVASRYLSQQFVERLCSGDVMAAELVREVERVIFDLLTEPEKLNCSDFAELRQKLTQSIDDERTEVAKDILSLNKTIEEHQNNIKALPEKRRAKQKTVADVEGYRSQLANLTTGNQTTQDSPIGDLRTRLSELNSQAASISDRLNSVGALKSHVGRLQSGFERVYSELSGELKKAGIPEDNWSHFKIGFRGDVSSPISAAERRYARELSDLKGDSTDTQSDTISRVSKLIQDEDAKLQMDETRRKKVSELQTRISRLDASVRKLNEEIGHAEHISKAALPRTVQDRMAKYLRYFELLSEERDVLSGLFGRLTKQVIDDSGDNPPLQFDVTTVVDIAAWTDRGESMLDLRRAGSLSTHGALLNMCRERLQQPWLESDADLIRSGIEDLVKVISEDGIERKLRSGFSRRDIADWVFSVDHIRLEFGLKYEGTPLRYLTPGIRGILLLILYLSLDRSDDRPLIIDQPEENLDNASVYSVLVEYFREAKQRRQVILVSHNPNLVVNTDSEEIVIADATRRDDHLPVIAYSTGPIEEVGGDAPSIRERTCEVLEGGKVAFLRREKRYAISGVGSIA